jgi:hypothetical protein
MDQHPVKQPIGWLHIDCRPGVNPYYRIGEAGVTRIEACTKSGPHSDIPYLRVWAGAECLAEYCQHNIIGVGFLVEGIS